MLGYNYRMTNIQAAILCGQLDALPTILSMKNDIFNQYRSAFMNREDVAIQIIDPNTKNANWMFGIRVINNINYELTEKFFTAKNIEIRPIFYPMSTHSYLQNNPNVSLESETNAILLNKECFIIPSFPELTKEEQKYIITTVNEYINLYH